ncbi:MAG: hypothetical protein NT080_03705 [Spirochaetes bacterium]|nr:hypothetical protein [Spirochaetota bacterium]
MIKEFRNVRQNPDGFRRLYLDEYFDLYIWYDREEGDVVGFQLVYDKPGEPRSLTWTIDRGYSHNKIDEGEDSCLSNLTPILVPDGAFDGGSVKDRFERESAYLDETLRRLVLDHIGSVANAGIRDAPL